MSGINPEQDDAFDIAETIALVLAHDDALRLTIANHDDPYSYSNPTQPCVVCVSGFSDGEFKIEVLAPSLVAAMRELRTKMQEHADEVRGPISPRC